MGWITGWNKRIKLTISGSCIEGDLSDFPIMVHLDSTCSGVFNELGSNSKRISVVNSEQSQCYVEVERWDESTNNAWLWVKVPTLSSGVDSDLYLYYDNLHSDNSAYVGTVGETPVQSVWDSNFMGVWHMSQDPTGGTDCIKDSTSNNKHGTPAGSMISDDLVDGKIGKAIDFDCNDELINLPQIFQSPTELTWELCTKSKVSDTTEQRLFVYNNDGVFVITSINAGTLNLIRTYTSADTGGGWSDTTTAYSVTSDHYIVGTAKNDDYLYLFVDNEKIGNGVSLGTMDDTGSDLARKIGANRNNGALANGIIDEVRISKIVRSNAWIKATYYSNWNQLLSYGTEETVFLGILPGWGNRLKLTIQNDHIDNTLTNFPVMIKLSNDSGYNSFDNSSVFYELEANINRKKIAITDSTGVAQCFVEIERFSCEETEAVLWTRLPIIYDSIGTHFYLYYDKSQADNNLFVGDVNSIVAQNVWDDSFVGVWHMNQDPTGGAGCIKDSTSNSNHGTPGGAMASGDLVDGKVGKALDFDGSDDYVTVVDNSILDLSSQMTLECIIKLDLDQTGTVRQVIAKDNSYNLNFDHASTDFKGVIGFKDTTSGWNHGGGPVTISKDEYYNFVGTYGGTYLKTYLNGIEKASNNVGTKTIDNSTGDLYFGSHNTSLSDGIFDEIRISKTARSAPWIKATYHSNWDSLVIFEKEDITASWLSDWSKRIKLTIDHTKIDSSLIDFPVLVTLTSGIQNDFFSGMSSSDSKKIAVTKNDGLTQCPVEIEQFDTASGIVNLWTKISTIVFDNDTVFYLYYDKNKDDNDSYVGDIGSTPARNVWDDYFVGVWHLGNTLLDSTSNGNNGTNYGTTVVDGKAGKARNFNGSSNYISLPIKPTLNSFTMSNIFKPNVIGSIMVPLDNGWWTATQAAFTYISATNVIYNGIRDGGTTSQLVATDASETGTWYDNTVTADGTTYKTYMNGVIDKSDNINLNVVSANNLILGKKQNVNDLYFNGIEDETRISNIARSASWIKATYYSNWNTLLTYGDVRGYTPPPDYYYHGYVKEKGGYVSRKLYLYRRDTGLLIDSCMSNAGTGYYLLETSVSGEHFILVLDDDAGDSYNALVQDRLYPNGI